jgi:hypothetical protein
MIHQALRRPPARSTGIVHELCNVWGVKVLLAHTCHPPPSCVQTLEPPAPLDWVTGLRIERSHEVSGRESLEPNSRCGRQCHQRYVSIRATSETSAEIVLHTICMCSPPFLSKRRYLPRPQAQRESIPYGPEDEKARHSTLCEGPIARSCRTIVRTLPVPHGGVAVVAPLAWSNLRWGIGTLPRQTGVFVPRRLSHVSAPVTGPVGTGMPATP